MNLERYIDSLAERLQTSAHVKNVYGKPVEAHGKTVIPVARVRYAFGSGPARLSDGETIDGIAGGGGAIQAEPVGVCEIDDTGTRFIPIDEGKKVLGALLVGGLVGLVVGLLVSSR